MKKNIIIIFLLSILSSILFFSNSLGINMLLFNIPLLIYFIWLLKSKKGIIFTLPIIILSLTYLLYNNDMNILNIIALIILFVLMFIYTIKPTYKINEIVNEFINITFGSLDSVDKFFKSIKNEINNLKISPKNKSKIKSILIVLPIIVIILILLTSADMEFSKMFSSLFDKLKFINLENLVLRIIFISVIFVCLGSLVDNLLYRLKDKGNYLNYKELKIENYTMKLLLTVLNIIYVVFDFIQIRSLLLHQVSENIDYAQYARSGFFQLLVISIINISIILISKKTKENKYIKTMNIVMILLTLIIIASSFIRMNMYESEFGYTTLRLLVYVSLITEVVLLIPTVLYVLNSKINILKYYMIIIIGVYSLVNLVSVDYVIANNNINRYYKTNNIDINYLMNYNTDNIPLLIKFYNDVNDEKIKSELRSYFNQMNDLIDNENIFEYNISKAKAVKKLKELKNEK